MVGNGKREKKDRDEQKNKKETKKCRVRLRKHRRVRQGELVFDLSFNIVPSTPLSHPCLASPIHDSRDYPIPQGLPSHFLNVSSALHLSRIFLFLSYGPAATTSRRGRQRPSDASRLQRRNRLRCRKGSVS